VRGAVYLDARPRPAFLLGGVLEATGAYGQGLRAVRPAFSRPREPEVLHSTVQVNDERPALSGAAG